MLLLYLRTLLNRTIHLFVILFLHTCDPLNHSPHPTCQSIKFTHKQNSWSQHDLCNFSLPVSEDDSTYDIYIVIHYTDQYPFYNLHLHHAIVEHSNKEIHKKVDDIHLFDEVTGNPLGTTKFLSKIYTKEILLVKNHQIPKNTKQNVVVQQFMRVESIIGICEITLKLAPKIQK